MDKKVINVLDGSEEEREKIMKEFFGLTENQSFQDLNVDEENKLEIAEE